MTDHQNLKPEDRALIEHLKECVKFPNTLLRYSTTKDAIERLLSLYEGRESRPSGGALRPGDIAWLERAKDAGHCGEGSMESKARHDHNERIDRILAALSPSVGTDNPRLDVITATTREIQSLCDAPGRPEAPDGFMLITADEVKGIVERAAASAQPDAEGGVQ